MRRSVLRSLAGLAVLVVASTPAPAWPEGDGDVGVAAPAPALFTAEVFATPSYHMIEIPKVEEGGEGFAWAYLNQQPEAWGRAITFWPGPTPETVFETSTPQQGPLVGHGYKAPGAWTSYPTGGDSEGDADFGEPAQFPLGPSVDTPGGTLRLYSFHGHSDANQGIGDVAFGAFTGKAAPVTIGFARSFASARRDGDSALSTGWALARDVHIGDVGITEIRSDASVKATAAGETGTWTLTVSGVSIGGQRLEWTDKGVSFAPGSEGPLQQLNAELAKGSENFRSELQLVPGRVWKDGSGTHVRSGFLQMGHRPVVTENNPGQKLVYAFSVVSAQAFYKAEDPDAGLGDELPLPGMDTPPDLGVTAPAPAVAAGNGPAATEIGGGVSLVNDVGADLFGAPGAGYGTDLSLPVAEGEVPPAGEAAGAGEAALVVPGVAAGSEALAAPATLVGLGEDAARDLRGGIGVAALAGVAALLVVLRAARRQIELASSTATAGREGSATRGPAGR